jgi:SAM-dependent methyltransferase
LTKNSHRNNCQQGEAFSPVFDGSLGVAADQHDRMPQPERRHTSQINYSVDLLRRDEAERSHITDELSLIKEEYGINSCTLLEVGCGLAQNLEIFRASNSVIGIEGLPSAVNEACSRGLAVIEGDLQSPLAIASDSIDWLLCLDVLEHLEQPLCLMLEMRRVLRVRGRAVLNVPNHFDLSGRLKLLMGHNLDVHNFFPGSDDWDNPHLRFFTHDGIKRLVAASGFQLVQDRSGHFCSFPKVRLFQAAGLHPVLRYLAEKKPSLFAGGFFLIIEKPLGAVDNER